jgi:hypothetical protein
VKAVLLITSLLSFSALVAQADDAGEKPIAVCVEETPSATSAYKIYSTDFSAAKVQLPRGVDHRPCPPRSIDAVFGLGSWNTYRVTFAVENDQMTLEFPNFYSPSTGTLTNSSGTHKIVCAYLKDFEQ